MPGDPRCMYSAEHAMYVANFIGMLKHTKSPFTGKPFNLIPWQQDFVNHVYGNVNEQGLRETQYCYLEIPKKNGKTELGAALALYHTFADGEMYGEIYSCAADKGQASQAFDVAAAMIEQCPALKKRTKPRFSQKMLEDKLTHSVYRAISAEAYSKHGFNLSCCIFDELHAQPNRDLWDIMTFGAGDARLQPLWYVITTAGDDADRSSIGWEIHEKALKIIRGEIVEPRWYCKVFGIEPDFEGDIYDEKLWYEVNPSLGITIDIEKVRQAALSARNSEQEERLFRWLRLNQWVTNKRIGWLPLELWDRTERDWNEAELLGERCYVGLDLSSKNDLTSANCLFPPSKKHTDWRTIKQAWIPEYAMKERSHRDKVPYDRWVRDRYLNATPGDVVDYGLIAKDLEAIEARYNVQYYCCDPWHLEYLKQLLPEKLQNKFVEIPQTMAGMSCAMGEIERMLKTGELTHTKDPVARWSFGNVRVAIDGNENQKPMKNKSIERIDPTVAMINAMAGAVKLETKRSVYETRGLRVV